MSPGGPAHVYPQRDSMRVTKLSLGRFDNNVYLLHCTTTNEAFLIDAATEPDRLHELLAGVTLVGILQTHGHFDHVQALAHLADEYDVPIYTHPGDEYPAAITPVEDGSTLRVGEIEVRVLHTPGHTPGSTCYLARGHLFSGDALFPAGPGATQSPEEFAQAMAAVDRLMILPDDTIVSPGHGLDTRIGRERPHIETWRARGW